MGAGGGGGGRCCAAGGGGASSIGAAALGSKDELKYQECSWCSSMDVDVEAEKPTETSSGNALLRSTFWLML